MKDFLKLLINKIGLGVNTYLPSPRILICNFKKILGNDVDIRVSRELDNILELEFNFKDKTMYIQYTLKGFRVVDIDIF